MKQRLVCLAALPLLAACSLAVQGDEILAVHAVQGAGPTSPLAGKPVRVRGIVTGDFQRYGASDHGDLGGFYIASIEADGDPATSEGLFVFEDGRQLGDVAPGDIVELDGVVTEFFGETQLAATALRVTGRGKVTAAPLRFPVDDFERYEGMLLRVDEPVAIAGNRNLGRFGTLTLTAGDRPYQYTNANRPDRDGVREARRELATRRLVLDDGFRRENIREVRYLQQAVPPRAGNGVAGLTGVLRWSRGSGGEGDEAYRLMPTAEPRFHARNPRVSPAERKGNLRVVSFNLLNLFNGLNDGNATCGPDGDANCRGANTAAELERQLAKTTTAFRYLDADIVGVAELENDARGSLELLVTALARAGLDYDFVDAGAIGDGTIKVGLLFRRSAVRPVGTFDLLDQSVDGRFDSRRNRPALAQTFELLDNGTRLTVIANHLKSKGSDCDEVNDPDREDGQGNCNRTRTLAAAALADYATRTAPDNGKVLVIGDLNAYLREDPIRALESGGLVNLLDREAGDAAYTYVFSARAGTLDYAFATPALAADVTQAFAWHSNADEPRVLDYNLDFGRNPQLFDAESPWRSSDHDPVVADFALAP